MFRKANTNPTLQAAQRMNEKNTTLSLGNLLTQYCSDRVIWLLTDIDGGKQNAETKRKSVSDAIRENIDHMLKGLHYDDKKEMLLKLIESSRFGKGTRSHDVIVGVMSEVMTNLGFAVRYSAADNKRVLKISKK